MAGLSGSLFLFHTDSNVGYSIAALERVFYEVALEIAAGDPSRVHFGYRSFDNGRPESLPTHGRRSHPHCPKRGPVTQRSYRTATVR